jgi:hypothetical protein
MGVLDPGTGEMLRHELHIAKGVAYHEGYQPLEPPGIGRIHQQSPELQPRGTPLEFK